MESAPPVGYSTPPAGEEDLSLIISDGTPAAPAHHLSADSWYNGARAMDPTLLSRFGDGDAHDYGNR
jgi:hypothetical protein